MFQDTTLYDSLDARPLPQWLINQRDGLNCYQPDLSVMAEDDSLIISLIVTGVIIFVTVLILTFYFLRRKKKQLNP